MSFLDNGVIRLGVDLGMGGTITYLSSSGSDVNVVNSHNHGSEVQPLFTSGPNGSWNALGAAGTVLEQSNDGVTIYTKAAPPCECLIEQWITLDGNAAQVRTRLTNNRSDHTQYDAWGQQEPAVYTNGTFWRLFTYNGNAPYTGGPLSQIIGVPGQIGSATEHWAALVNDAGFGLGVFTPFTTQYVGGFNGTPDTGGPSDSPTGSIIPGTDETLDWNIVYDYEYALVLGTLDQIRAYAVVHRPDSIPDFQFVDDRQHFGLFHATDTGWPINGALHVNLDQFNPSLIIVGRSWQAPDVPRIYITAAYHHRPDTNARLFWTVAGQDQSFPGEQSVPFTPIVDGRFHTYALDLAGLPGYQGTVTGLQFDPSAGPDPGASVDIVSISADPPSADLAISKTDSADPVTVGSALTYTITVTNNGPSTATGVTMSDALPGTLTFVSVASSQGSCTTRGTIKCNLGILVSDDSATVTIVVTPTQPGGINNTATVSADEPDPDASNNSATQVTTIVGQAGSPLPDLAGNWQSVAQTCRGRHGAAKCSIKGTLNVVNQGTAAAGGCVVRLYLSDDTTFDASDVQIGEVGLPSLPAGGQRVLKFKASLPAGSNASGKFVIAVLDAGGIVTETDKSNNNVASARLP
jgi:uncharacterized repeat protein (TIGR01451 family)